MLIDLFLAPVPFGRTIEQGEHGRFLETIGFGGDMRVATEIVSMPVLPVLRDGRLSLVEG